MTSKGSEGTGGGGRQRVGGGERFQDGTHMQLGIAAQPGRVHGRRPPRDGVDGAVTAVGPSPLVVNRQQCRRQTAMWCRRHTGAHMHICPCTYAHTDWVGCWALRTTTSAQVLLRGPAHTVRAASWPGSGCKVHCTPRAPRYDVVPVCPALLCFSLCCAVQATRPRAPAVRTPTPRPRRRECKLPRRADGAPWVGGWAQHARRHGGRQWPTCAAGGRSRRQACHGGHELGGVSVAWPISS